MNLAMEKVKQKLPLYRYTRMKSVASFIVIVDSLENSSISGFICFYDLNVWFYEYIFAKYHFDFGVQ